MIDRLAEERLGEHMAVALKAKSHLNDLLTLIDLQLESGALPANDYHWLIERMETQEAAAALLRKYIRAAQENNS